MKTKLLSEIEGRRTFAIVFDTDDEVATGLKSCVNELKIDGAYFTAIGAFRDVTVGYFNIDKNEYDRIQISEQVEVLSLMGNVARHKQESKIHAHLVIGKSDGSAHGGHLLEAHVRPTLEVILTETPKHLQRIYDDATGLALIEL